MSDYMVVKNLEHKNVILVETKESRDRVSLLKSYLDKTHELRK